MLHGVVATLSTASLLASSLMAPSMALARPKLTPEEQLTIEIFKRSTPSVVNVTNLAIKCVRARVARGYATGRAGQAVNCYVGAGGWEHQVGDREDSSMSVCT